MRSVNTLLSRLVSKSWPNRSDFGRRWGPGEEAVSRFPGKHRGNVKCYVAASGWNLFQTTNGYIPPLLAENSNVFQPKVLSWDFSLR